MIKFRDASGFALLHSIRRIMRSIARIETSITIRKNVPVRFRVGWLYCPCSICSSLERSDLSFWPMFSPDSGEYLADILIPKLKMNVIAATTLESPRQRTRRNCSASRGTQRSLASLFLDNLPTSERSTSAACIHHFYSIISPR